MTQALGDPMVAKMSDLMVARWRKRWLRMKAPRAKGPLP